MFCYSMKKHTKKKPQNSGKDLAPLGSTRRYTADENLSSIKRYVLVIVVNTIIVYSEVYTIDDDPVKVD